jgi:hypothetical protein
MLDPRRFWRLAMAEWAENRRGWAWFLGAVVIIHFVLVLALLAGEESYRAFDLEGQTAVFLIGLFLTGPVFAARYFQAVSRPGPALLALMRPASAFETWLLGFVVVVVAYPLAYHLVFYVCDVPATLVAAQRAAAELGALPPPTTDDSMRWARASLAPEHYRFFTLPRADIGPGGYAFLVTAFVAVQAFAMTGALLFRRMPFIKTMLAGFFVLLACVLVAALFDSDPDKFFDYWTELASAHPNLTPAQRIVFPATWIGVPVLLWLAAFLALREREVA